MKDNEHKIKLFRLDFPENTYICIKCGRGWIAKNRKQLVGGTHLSFMADGKCPTQPEQKEKK